MDITVKGLKHPHRYVLDAAQTHIYMLMKKVGRAGRECAGKSSRPRVPGCRGRGVRGRGRKSSRPGSRMRGNRDCVVAAFLLLGAELSAVSGLAPPSAPEPSGQGGAAAAAEALSGLLTLQLKGRPDRVTAPTSVPTVRAGGSPSLHILSSGFCLQTFS